MRLGLRSAMRFVQFQVKSDLSLASASRLGVQLQGTDDVIDLSSMDTSLPSTLVGLLRQDADALNTVKSVLDRSSCTPHTHPLSELILRPPVTHCDKVIAAGMNYKDHCKEQNLTEPKYPIFTSKFTSAITGPDDNIIYPDVTKELDWEVELAVVIGRTAKNVPENSALEHVFGYTVANDVSARDWQMKYNGRQWVIGKSMDTFCPIGPAVVTTDDIPDALSLGLRSRVNGELMQNSNTEQMIFSPAYLIAFISRMITLLPGDLLLTGTPGGVGVFREPPVFLQRGDVVECEIDMIGTLHNPVI